MKLTRPQVYSQVMMDIEYKNWTGHYPEMHADLVLENTYKELLEAVCNLRASIMRMKQEKEDQNGEGLH